MKLSDMLTSMAENARLFEQRSADWQSQMSSRNEEMMAEIRKWQAGAVERQDDLSRQLSGYMNEAGEALKTQWAQMQSTFETQFAQLKTQGDEMREAAMKTAGGKDGKGFADWAEAYATQMTSFAQKMQAEAAGAIATATEARAKSTRKT